MLLYNYWLFSNKIILQFGIVKNVPNNSVKTITLPTAYQTFFVGVTDMYGKENNGCVTRFNKKTLTSFEIGNDTLVAVYITVDKVWITIGY